MPDVLTVEDALKQAPEIVSYLQPHPSQYLASPVLQAAETAAYFWPLAQVEIPEHNPNVAIFDYHLSESGNTSIRPSGYPKRS